MRGCLQEELEDSDQVVSGCRCQGKAQGREGDKNNYHTFEPGPGL